MRQLASMNNVVYVPLRKCKSVIYVAQLKMHEVQTHEIEIIIILNHLASYVTDWI